MRKETSDIIIKEELNYCIDRLSLYGLKTTIQEIRGLSREAHVNGMRALIAEILRQKKYTFVQIGAILNRDHASVMHMLRYDEFKSGRMHDFKKFRKKLLEDSDVREISEQIDRYEKAIVKLKAKLNETRS